MKVAKKGIDVSYHQGVIDWAKVKASGVQFAIIRAGYGRTNVDEQFFNNVKGCIENDIPFEIYWFIYGINEEESIQNAAKCHRTISAFKDKISGKVWCDLEYDTDANARKRGVTLTKDMRTKMVIAFCEKMKQYGYEVGNYANPDYLENKFNDLSQYPLWLAWYNATENSAREYNCEMWQYSSKGSVPGISGNVDMNYLYKEAKEEVKTEEKENAKMIEINAYSKTKDGNKKLAANFKVKEFACKDGSDPIFVAPELVELLQKIRNHFGKAVVINSAYRTPTYNKKVGGATQSQHLYGMAADIKISGVNPKAVAAYVETLLPNRGGIGIYANFTHVDVRETKSRWNG